MRPNRRRKALGIARLQERVREGLVRDLGPVVPGSNTDGARVRNGQLPQQCGKPPLVDEGVEALERWQARRESAASAGGSRATASAHSSVDGMTTRRSTGSFAR